MPSPYDSPKAQEEARMVRLALQYAPEFYEDGDDEPVHAAFDHLESSSQVEEVPDHVRDFLVEWAGTNVGAWEEFSEDDIESAVAALGRSGTAGTERPVQTYSGCEPTTITGPLYHGSGSDLDHLRSGRGDHGSERGAYLIGDYEAARGYGIRGVENFDDFPEDERPVPRVYEVKLDNREALDCTVLAGEVPNPERRIAEGMTEAKQMDLGAVIVPSVPESRDYGGDEVFAFDAESNTHVVAVRPFDPDVREPDEKNTGWHSVGSLDDVREAIEEYKTEKQTARYESNAGLDRSMEYRGSSRQPAHHARGGRGSMRY